MDFRRKLLGLAGAVVAFSGMAYAQPLNCVAANGFNAGAVFIRAEGQTELLPTLTITCTGGGDIVANNTASLQIFLSPTVAITSAVTNTTTGATAATATATTSGGTAPGIVSGNSITFSNIPIATNTSGFTITGLRVNATSVPVTVGQQPTPINAQVFVSGGNVTPGPTASIPVAYALNGLLPVKIFSGGTRGGTANKASINASTVTSFGICAAINNSSTAGSSTANFAITVDEAFQNSFKKQTEEGAGANSGTRVAVTFTNIPSGLNIYLPVTVASDTVAAAGPPVVLGPGVLTAIASATAPTSAGNNQTAATTPSAVSGNGLFQVTVSGGSATAYYEVTNDNPAALDTFSIPVTLVASTNAVGLQSSSLTVATSFAPVTAATTIPSFAAGSSTVPAPVIGFTACTTSLLFPFVTNASGFETGIAISNTTKDPFSTRNQNGTCMLNFYGSGTSPNAVVAPNTIEGAGKDYVAGESYAFTLSNALAVDSKNPATFQGYLIAQCGFQNAHGFAYITYAFPGTSSSSMGYLAVVLSGRGSVGPEVTYQ